MDTGIKFGEIWTKSVINNPVSHINFFFTTEYFFYILRIGLEVSSLIHIKKKSPR